MRCEICVTGSSQWSRRLASNSVLHKVFGIAVVCGACEDKLFLILDITNRYAHDVHKIRDLAALSSVRQSHKYYGSITLPNSKVCGGCGARMRYKNRYYIYKRDISLCRTCAGAVYHLRHHKYGSVDSLVRNFKQHEKNLLSFITKMRIRSTFNTNPSS